MKRLNTLITGLSLAAIVSGSGIAPAVQADEQQLRGRDLMTSEELAAHRNAMRTINSQQERARYREAKHTQMQQRAAAQGVTLSGGPGTPRGGYGYGSMDDDHRGYGGYYVDADDAYGRRGGRGYGWGYGGGRCGGRNR